MVAVVKFIRYDDHKLAICRVLSGKVKPNDILYVTGGKKVIFLFLRENRFFCAIMDELRRFLPNIRFKLGGNTRLATVILFAAGPFDRKAIKLLG